MRDFVLYTPFYLSSNEERNAENLYCLKKNLEHPDIVKVYLLNEEEKLPIEHEKLVHISIPKRPSFAYIFDVISKQDTGSSIKILANTDIYFDETLAKAKDIKNNEIYALTRWDKQTDGSKKFFLKYHSQDAWIFTIDLDKSIGHFPMGQPGCDNRLVYEFNNIGYEVKNPSFSIHITHVHASGFRPYLNESQVKYVQGEYAYLMPEFIGKVQKEYARDYYYLNWEYNWYFVLNKHYRLKYGVWKRFISIFSTMFYFLMFQLNKR